MLAGDILTLQIPDQKAVRGLSGVKMKQLLVGRVLYFGGEMGQCLQNMGMKIRGRKDRIVLYYRGLEIQRRDCSRIGENHVPLKGRIETQE
jgi:hypothetical protein